MRYLGRRQTVAEHFLRTARFDLHDLPGEPPPGRGRAGKQQFKRRVEPSARAGRAGDEKGAAAPALMLRIDEQEGQPAEVVAVQVGDNDTVKAVRVDAARAERHHRGGSAIDQHRRIRRLHPEAGVEPAAGTEGIARSHDGEPHAHRSAELIRSLRRRVAEMIAGTSRPSASAALG